MARRPQPEVAISDLSWLARVQEVQHPLSGPHPIWVRQVTRSHGPPPPQPTVPHPEQHPYCEFNLISQGRVFQYVGRERIERGPGTVLLLGPGIPHYGIFLSYPTRGLTVYFLPSLLLEMGPAGDGAKILSRFTMAQMIQNRVVRLPVAQRKYLQRGFAQMLAEFERGGFGSELRLRAILIEMLVAFLRWEERARGSLIQPAAVVDWQPLERALQHVHQHYTEPLYIRQVAAVAGVGVRRLQAMFRQGLGMSCAHYLLAYRISRAVALLCAPAARVTEVAFAVGFGTLSHFNTAFRQFTGCSPTAYMRRQARTFRNRRKTG